MFDIDEYLRMIIYRRCQDIRKQLIKDKKIHDAHERGTEYKWQQKKKINRR